MNKLVCNYAVVRFLPYRETGEFVNVGVVIHCPETDFLDFKLETRHTKRIKDFFPELDIKILEASMKNFNNHLNSYRTVDMARFQELVRIRESILYFGAHGTVLTDDPTFTLNELFLRFVERFIQHQQ